ncbi:hypothetical protein [Thermocoleostomius sinensis]|uniref:Uncharacterized protein n=1 Tax=Thermocoleostomius sinensis A174 TaxID=2016057 RepID=A0A9E8ZG42_9CYAN|nr:hypothetical protein [Thermocoleostomius sinensis]WAL60585.1 hypothetical protein OXH18_00900 [Thermocoleostomius sinensis A174]
MAIVISGFIATQPVGAIPVPGQAIERVQPSSMEIGVVGTIGAFYAVM